MPATAKYRSLGRGCSQAEIDPHRPREAIDAGRDECRGKIQKIIEVRLPREGVRLYAGANSTFVRVLSFIEATESVASTVTAVLSLSGATTQGLLLYSIHPALQWTLSMAEIGVLATAGASVLTIIREYSGDLPLAWEACMRIGIILSPWATLATSALLIVTTSSTWAPFYATAFALNTGGIAFAEWTRVILRKTSGGLTRTLGTVGAWFGAFVGAACSVILTVSVASVTGPLSLILYSGLCQLGWGQATIGLAVTGGMSAAGAVCGGVVGVAAGTLNSINLKSSTAEARRFWFDWLSCDEQYVEQPDADSPSYDLDASASERFRDVLCEIGWLP